MRPPNAVQARRQLNCNERLSNLYQQIKRIKRMERMERIGISLIRLISEKQFEVTDKRLTLNAQLLTFKLK